MKKLLALVLSLVMLFTCAAVLADEAEEEPEIATATYQFRNSTGEAVTSFVFKDNRDGLAVDLLGEGVELGADEVVIYQIEADPDDTKEDLEHRYTVSFTTEGGYTAEFATLSFEDVLIDLLPKPEPDAVSGATPIRFNFKMLQVGNYRIINNTEKLLEKVVITENATGRSQVFQAMADPGMETYFPFTIGENSEGRLALTIAFTFRGGVECSFGTLSIEDVSLTVTEDTITGATPFIFGSFDAE